MFCEKNSDGTNKLKHKEIDFEFKPLVSDLHNKYLTEQIITTKDRVIRYFNNLDIAKQLFVINYKKRPIKKDEENIENNENHENHENISMVKILNKQQCNLNIFF